MIAYVAALFNLALGALNIGLYAAYGHWSSLAAGIFGLSMGLLVVLVEVVDR